MDVMKIMNVLMKNFKDIYLDEVTYNNHNKYGSMEEKSLLIEEILKKDVKDTEWTVAVGCDKLCINCLDEKEVIKVPLFLYKNCLNSIDRENNMINKICKNHILAKSFFLSNKFEGKYGVIPVYTQEKVTVLENILDTIEYSENEVSDITSQKGIFSIYDYFSFYCDDIYAMKYIKAMYEYYNKETIEDILSILQEYEISDLHEGNLGFLNGRPVIIDFHYDYD